MTYTIFFARIVFIYTVFTSIALCKPYDLKFGTIDIPKGFVMEHENTTDRNFMKYRFDKSDVKTKQTTYITIVSYNYKNDTGYEKNKARDEILISYIQDTIIAHRKNNPVTFIGKPGRIKIGGKSGVTVLLGNDDKLNAYISSISATLSGDNVIVFYVIEPDYIEPRILFDIMDRIESFKYNGKS